MLWGLSGSERRIGHAALDERSGFIDRRGAAVLADVAAVPRKRRSSRSLCYCPVLSQHYSTTQLAFSLPEVGAPSDLREMSSRLALHR
jgi:hypothetical protein